MDDSKLATGEGRSTVTSTCIQNGAGGLKPQGGSPADVDAEERTAENRRSLREKMRIGTWNVRTMNQGKLDIMKREMERTGVELMGISEMRWTGMGHFMSDNCEVYYCGQEILRRNGVAFICIQTKYEDVLWDSTLKVTARSGRDTERRCAVCDRRLECQSGAGRDKRHNRKIRTGGTE